MFAQKIVQKNPWLVYLWLHLDWKIAALPFEDELHGEWKTTSLLLVAGTSVCVCVPVKERRSLV